ncbi:MAG: acyl-CoA dehydrogenase family protein, partial [Alphaproteobacteria bacterium]
MASFEIGDELEEFRGEVRKLAEGRFREKAAYWDEHEEFPEENKKVLADLGYLGTLVPEEYGGQGGTILQGAIFVEELARVCFNTSLIAQLYLNGPSRAISVLGSEEQKKRWLPGSCSGEFFHSIGISEPHAGSAVTELKTSVEMDGNDVVINGSKCFVTGGHRCTHIFIFARARGSEGSKGIGAMMIERG